MGPLQNSAELANTRESDEKARATDRFWSARGHAHGGHQPRRILRLPAQLPFVILTSPAATRFADTSSLPAPRADLTDLVIPAGTPIAAAVNWLQGALSIRSSQLQTLSDDVTAAHWLTTQDASALTNIVSSATSGMERVDDQSGQRRDARRCAQRRFET